MLNLLVASALTTHYVELGALAGSYDGFHGGAADIEGGWELAHTPMWLHSSFALGGAGLDGVDGSGVLYRMAAGVELRHCIAGSPTCLVGGVDLGIEGASAGHASGTFDNGTPTGDGMHEFSGHGVAIPRIGLESGSETVRFALTVEVPRDISGNDRSGGVTATAGVMFSW